ncbi:MAG: hypothetical protein CMG75_04925 [Candidatus Marinimicrobia bacterium]|nr:hypothetical protein [Candidatus Neomarinimicrobiota bacterium]|tara:strand:+ start:5058 stop:6116 length:1059 start_codon:yes stop_codon:yes gene_type:complete
MLKIKSSKIIFSFSSLLFFTNCLININGTKQFSEYDQWVEYEGGNGPGNGKHIVFVTADQEYRAEEGMPQLAKILSKRHGFKCTVLFPIDKKTGFIDPEELNNIPGLESLDSADLMFLVTRRIELPDNQMKYIIDYTNSGKPIIGLRTANHPFQYDKNTSSPYAKYSGPFGYTDESFSGGYGRQVFGDTWVDHYGHHGKESTRGLIAKGQENHPIVQGCEDIWGPTDVYEVGNLIGNSKPIIMGQVLSGMNPNDPPNEEKSLMPLAWTKTYLGETGNVSRIFFTTMGAATDLESEGLRRLLVNASYWCLGLEDKILQRSNVDIIGTYNPTDFGFNNYKRGIYPKAHRIKKIN